MRPLPPRAKVVLIGAGGLGSPVALALSAWHSRTSAVNLHLEVWDPDRVDLSNLHRQLLFGQEDLGKNKAEAAQQTLGRQFPGLSVGAMPKAFGTDAVASLVPDSWDRLVLVEGSDSLETKFLVNDLAFARGIPAVIGGVVRWSGQILTVLPRQTACYRCLFEDPPAQGVPTCQGAGVLGPSCGVIGARMAGEVRALLLENQPEYAGAILTYNLLEGKGRKIPLRRRATCPCSAGL